MLVLAKPTINCFIIIRQWFKRYISEMLSLVAHSSRNSQKVSNVIQLIQTFIPLRLTCCGCHCYITSASSLWCTLLMTRSQMLLYLYWIFFCNYFVFISISIYNYFSWMYVSTPCVCRATWSQKWTSDPLKLKVHIVVSHHVYARN